MWFGGSSSFCFRNCVEVPAGFEGIRGFRPNRMMPNRTSWNIIKFYCYVRVAPEGDHVGKLQINIRFELIPRSHSNRQSGLTLEFLIFSIYLYIYLIQNTRYVYTIQHVYSATSMRTAQWCGSTDQLGQNQCYSLFLFSYFLILLPFEVSIESNLF